MQQHNQSLPISLGKATYVRKTKRNTIISIHNYLLCKSHMNAKTRKLPIYFSKYKTENDLNYIILREFPISTFGVQSVL